MESRKVYATPLTIAGRTFSCSAEPQHRTIVELGEGIDFRLRHPVLMDICHSGTPIIDIRRLPLFGVQQKMVQFLQPAGEDGVRCTSGSRGCRCVQYACTALFLDPLGDLLPVEVPQIRQTTATS